MVSMLCGDAFEPAKHAGGTWLTNICEENRTQRGPQEELEYRVPGNSDLQPAV